MNPQFTIVRQNRKILYSYLKTLSDEELYTVPKGFNNNIWWNIAHVVATQQKLVYGLAGQPLPIGGEWVKNYQKGTFPKGKPTAEQVEALKALLFELPEKTEQDYKMGLFEDFKPYMTTPKVELKSVEDALAFNVFHEGLHLGSILALSKAVKF